MSIILAGLSHHTAAVELRECLAVVDESPESTLAQLLALGPVKEGFFVSTCNRVEFILVTEPEADPDDVSARLLAFIARTGRMEGKSFQDHLYLKQDREAVRHVFRVASSLDSMVIGEPQILGQVKDAYRRASGAKSLGVVLNRLMHRTFHVAKRVRTETGISDRAVSIAFAAVDLARKIFGALEGKQVLLLGAGEMAELAAEHLLAQRVAGLTVANRTLEKAMEVAGRFKGRAVSLDELESELVKADIVITSTASTQPVLTTGIVKRSLRPRRHRPLFLIDIAVPRDVETGVGRLENVFLYDVDDLEEVVARNLAERREEAVKAERIVEEEAIKFEDWLESLAVVPTIKGLQAKLESIREGELKRTLSHLELTPEQAQALETMTRTMMKKVLHDPALLLKRNFKNPDNRTKYLDATQRLFGLNGLKNED
jgi:glutamyl-tRNA reductase